MSWAGARRTRRCPAWPIPCLPPETASVSGLMDLPEEARKLGLRPSWLGYVGVNDVDATADRIKHLGGAVHVPPKDIPNISRFSVAVDPQMATIALFKWLTPGQDGQDRPAELEHAGPRRLARAARRRLGEGVGFLRRAFWLAESGRRHRRDGHVPAVLRRRADDRRHVHQASDGAGAVLALLLQRRRHRRGGEAREGGWRPGPRAARSKCRAAAAGSSNARTLRAPSSRWWESGATTVSDISSAPHRAIRATFVSTCVEHESRSVAAFGLGREGRWIK